jgi:hypothetical protein
MRRWLAILLLAGCASKNGSLLVVTVATSPSGAALTTVHAHVTTTARPGDFDLSFPAGTIAPASFGIDFPPEITGNVTVAVDGGALGSGSASTGLIAGAEADLTVTLGSAPGDGGVDLAGVDLAGADLASLPDLLTPIDFAGGADFAHVPVWTDETTGTAALNGVWGAGGAVFAVGDSGTILRSTGNGVWTAQTSGTTQTLNGVWASPAGFFYVAGNGGVLLYSNGAGTWQPQTTSTAANLYSVWGTSDSNVYVGGASGTVLHSPPAGMSQWPAQNVNGISDDWDGLWGTADGMNVYAANNGAGAVFYTTGNGSWTFQATGGSSNSSSVTGFGNTIYLAVTPVGTVLTATVGGSWSPLNAMVSKQLWGVFAVAAGDVWAVGDAGTITHLSGGSWTQQTISSTANLSRVWSDGNQVYVVGAAGTILHLH